MPPLTFPVQPDGLVLTVLIGLNQQETRALAAAGQPVPSPLWATAAVDTGSNITCVDARLLQRLGLSPTGQGSTQATVGQAPVRLFTVSLGIPLVGDPPGSLLLESQLTVMELTQVLPGVEALVGLDILFNGKLLLDGPARQFTLDF